MVTEKYKRDHWQMLGDDIKHRGPYVAFLVLGLIALHQAGWVDKPAWSSDIQGVDAQVKKLSIEVGDVQDKIDTVGRKQIIIETEVKNTNKLLDGINNRLDILIQNNLGRRRDQ